MMRILRGAEAPRLQRRPAAAIHSASGARNEHLLAGPRLCAFFTFK
jgi:hypothetical protein